MNVDERFYELTEKLWAGGSYAYYWTDGTDTGGLSDWFPVATRRDVPDIWRNVNVYFGVHPSNTLKTKQQRATIPDIQVANCLFAEFDLGVGQTQQHLLESINQIDIAPSVVIFSGGGYHCYWLLESTYKIHNDDSLNEITDIQYAWNEWTGGDNSVKDLARVLRVPGSKNKKPKYGPDYPTVEIAKFDLEQTYSIDFLRKTVESIIEMNRKTVQVNTIVQPVNVPANVKDRLEKMLHSDSKAAALWVGDLSSHKNDASAGDLALCNRLAYWFGRDKDVVDMMFRQSSLMRDKWANRDKYRDETLDMAIADTTHVYDPVNYYNNLNGNPQDLVGSVPSHRNSAKAPRTAKSTTGTQNGTQPTSTPQPTQSPQAAPTATAAPQPKKGSSADYIQSLASLGYSFKLNLLEDNVEVNGETITDVIASQINSQMRDLGYINMTAIRDALVANAAKSSYHPVKDYLQNLAWDGNDWIQILAGFFGDSHKPIIYADGKTQSVFYAWLKRWLIGSVAKIFDHAQNPVLVLDGSQNLGKSYFVNWLSSGMPSYSIVSPIRPDSNDHSRFLIKKWIWEVAELGSTTRRQDVDALKSFITLESVTVRKSYDRHEIQKPAMASFIGTINNETGFLTDTTGNRRYLSVNLTSIDHSYEKTVPIAQLWAQAYAIWNAGSESHRLAPEEITARDEINSIYQMEDPFEGWIMKYYDVDPDELKWRATTQEIVDVVQDKGVKGDTKGIQMGVAKALKAMGLSRDSNARPVLWKGIRLKTFGNTP